MPAVGTPCVAQKNPKNAKKQIVHVKRNLLGKPSMLVAADLVPQYQIFK